MKSKLVKGYIATLLSVVLWGASFVWINDIMTQCNFPPITLVTCRLLIAASLMFLIFKLMGKIEKVEKKDMRYLFLLAVFQPFLYFIGETYGIKFVGEASFASVMISLIPVFTPFAIALIYRRGLRPELILGAIISVLGVILMSFNVSGKGVSVIGVLFLIQAIITACGYNVILTQLLAKGYSPITITTYQNIFGAILYIPLFFIVDFHSFGTIIWSHRAVLDLLCLAVLCSAVAYMCYSYGASIISTEKEAMFNNAIPVFTIIFSVMIGQEILTIRKIIGMAVVIGGVMLSQQIIFKKKEINK